MSVTDELLRNTEQYAESFDKGDLPMPPGQEGRRRRVHGRAAHPDVVLGLEEGDAHVIRNAGGVVTEDEIRSLTISQRLLGTEEIILIHHTDCGMLTFTDDEFKRSIQADTGIKPECAAEAFADLDEDVRQSIARIKASPFIPTRTPCAASSTRSRRAGCARSSRRRVALGGGIRPGPASRRGRPSAYLQGVGRGLLVSCSR